MKKQNIQEELKTKYIQETKISTISFIVSFTSIMLVFIMLLFLLAFSDPSNNTSPIIMVVFVSISLVSLILGTVFWRKSKRTRGNVDFYTEEEQNNFLTKYLVIQPILITVLFISVFLITLGIIVKYREGIICSLVGLILLVIVLDVVMLLSNVKKTLKSKKSKVVDDAITTYSVFNNLQIIERAILSLTLIALIVMSFNAITNNQKIVLNIILIILSFAYYGYNLYVSIRCLNKFKGAKYKV